MPAKNMAEKKSRQNAGEKVDENVPNSIRRLAVKLKLRRVQSRTRTVEMCGTGPTWSTAATSGPVLQKLPRIDVGPGR
jgi:hypothetical protein